MKTTRMLSICAAVCIAMAVNAGGGYRVAGILQVSGSEFVALMEGPDGKQQNHRRGESLGDATITSIDADGVEVLLDGERRYLALQGRSVQLVSSGEAGPQPERIELEPRAVNISYDDVQDQLLSLRPGIDAEAAARAVHEALGLDAGSRIVSVDHDDIASAMELVDALLRDLSTNAAVRVVIEKDGKPQRVYFSDQ